MTIDGRILLLAAWFWSMLAYGQGVAFEALEDPALQSRYQALIEEVRCLTCLNRSIAESDTPLANDLRREIREMIAAGSTDREITGFLTERYGDFVLYRPPIGPRTYALWGAPVIFLAFGILLFVQVLRKRLTQPIDDDDVAAAPGAGDSETQA